MDYMRFIILILFFLLVINFGKSQQLDKNQIWGTSTKKSTTVRKHIEIYTEPNFNISKSKYQKIKDDYLESICNLNDTCAKLKDLPNDSDSEFWDLRRRNCMCDKDCNTYGDCCIDSKFYNPQLQDNFFSFNCYETFIGDTFLGIYIKTACPAGSDSEISVQCSESKNYTRILKDLNLRTPVTSRTSYITYGNIYCALCNNESDFDFWNLGIELINSSSTTDEIENSSSDLSNNLVFDETLNQWVTYFKNQSTNVTLDPMLPPNVASKVRYCHPNVISTCSAKNSGSNKKCSSFTEIVFQNPKVSGDTPIIYRNLDCANCNLVTEGDLKGCLPSLQARLRGIIPPFSILFDPKAGNPLHPKNNFCNSNPKLISSTKFYKHLCDTTSTNTTSKSELFKNGKICEISNFNSYETFGEKNNFSIIYIPDLDRNFSAENFDLFPNKTVNVCLYELNYQNKFLGIFSIICLLISIIFLSLHLYVFLTLEKLRNLSGKNLASFSLALLVVYVCFMVGPFVNKSNCVLIAYLTYYFLISGFCWMLIMSIDVWRSLWFAIKKLRSNTGKQRKKFIMYSIFSWLIPAILCATLKFLEKSKSSNNYKPKFGTDESIGCWFGNQKSLFIFFMIPFGIVMFLNFGFFCHSAYMIYLNTSASNVNSKTKSDYRLYTRLALLMGITWITGFIARYNILLEILFILLNANQGVLIFFGFTWKKEILDDLQIYRCLINKIPTSRKVSTAEATSSTFI